MNRSSPCRYPLSRVVMFGDTAHGLYSAATGQITTPEGVQIPCPGEAPFGADSFVVRVPGMPPLPPISPENAAADAAAGRTWLDYGILSGVDRRLYGMRLARRFPEPPESAWIYVDEAGGRWLVRIRNIVDGARFFRLTFRKFGHVEHGQAVGEIVQTIDVPSSLSIDVITRAREFFTSALGRPYRACVEAISSRGHRVVVLSHRYDYTTSYGVNEIQSSAGLVSNGLVDTVQHSSASIGSRGSEIELQGVPPYAEVAVRPLISGLVSTPQSLDVVLWHADGSGGIATTPATALPNERQSDVAARVLPPGSYVYAMTMPQGDVTRSGEVRQVVGAYYDAEDDLRLVDVVFTGQITHSFSLSLQMFDVGPRYTSSGALEISGSLSFSCAPEINIPYSVTTSSEASTMPGNVHSVDSVNYAVGGVSGADGFTGIPEVTLINSGFAQGLFDERLNRVSYSASAGLLYNTTGDSMFDRYVADLFDPTYYPLFQVLPLRFGSRCWGIGVHNVADGMLHLLALASPQQHKVLHKTGAASADLGWACAHPITGALTTGDIAQCHI